MSSSADLRAGLEAVPGCRIGLYARSLEGPQAGQEVDFFADEPLPSASLIKLLVLGELLRRADAGLSLSRTVALRPEALVGGSEMVSELDPPSRPTLRWLAQAMITVSDNTATNALIDLLTFHEINALARYLGLSNTLLGRYMMDTAARDRGEENYTSARDAAALLAELYKGELLSTDSRNFALGLLLAQRQPPGPPMNFPSGSRPAYKPGDLDDVRNCAALSLLPGRTFSIVVLVQGASPHHAYPALDAATGEVCRCLAGFRSSPVQPNAARDGL